MKNKTTDKMKKAFLEYEDELYKCEEEQEIEIQEIYLKRGYSRDWDKVLQGRGKVVVTYGETKELQHSLEIFVDGEKRECPLYVIEDIAELLTIMEKIANKSYKLFNIEKSGK